MGNNCKPFSRFSYSNSYAIEGLKRKKGLAMEKMGQVVENQSRPIKSLAVLRAHCPTKAQRGGSPNKECGLRPFSSTNNSKAHLGQGAHVSMLRKVHQTLHPQKTKAQYLALQRFNLSLVHKSRLHEASSEQFPFLFQGLFLARKSLTYFQKF